MIPAIILLKTGGQYLLSQSYGQFASELLENLEEMFLGITCILIVSANKNIRFNSHYGIR